VVRPVLVAVVVRPVYLICWVLTSSDFEPQANTTYWVVSSAA